MTSRSVSPPLPDGWDVRLTSDGERYFVCHDTHETTWVDPRVGNGVSDESPTFYAEKAVPAYAPPSYGAGSTYSHLPTLDTFNEMPEQTFSSEPTVPSRISSTIQSTTVTREDLLPTPEEAIEKLLSFLPTTGTILLADLDRKMCNWSKNYGHLGKLGTFLEEYLDLFYIHLNSVEVSAAKEISVEGDKLRGCDVEPTSGSDEAFERRHTGQRDDFERKYCRYWPARCTKGYDCTYIHAFPKKRPLADVRSRDPAEAEMGHSLREGFDPKFRMMTRPGFRAAVVSAPVAVNESYNGNAGGPEIQAVLQKLILMRPDQGSLPGSPFTEYCEVVLTKPTSFDEIPAPARPLVVEAARFCSNNSTLYGMVNELAKLPAHASPFGASRNVYWLMMALQKAFDQQAVEAKELFYLVGIKKFCFPIHDVARAHLGNLIKFVTAAEDDNICFWNYWQAYWDESLSSIETPVPNLSADMDRSSNRCVTVRFDSRQQPVNMLMCAFAPLGPIETLQIIPQPGSNGLTACIQFFDETHAQQATKVTEVYFSGSSHPLEVNFGGNPSPSGNEVAVRNILLLPQRVWDHVERMKELAKLVLRVLGRGETPFSDLTIESLLGDDAFEITPGFVVRAKACVRLRGLPFRTSLNEVRDFFEGFQIASNGIRFMRDIVDVGPTNIIHHGECYVHFESEAEALRAKRERDRKHIGTRYIEIFPIEADIIHDRKDAKLVFPSAVAAREAVRILQQPLHNRFHIDLIPVLQRPVTLT